MKLLEGYGINDTVKIQIQGWRNGKYIGTCCGVTEPHLKQPVEINEPGGEVGFNADGLIVKEGPGNYILEKPFT